MYSLLLAIIYLAFVSLGLPDSLIGAGWPVMHQDLGVPVAFAGIVTMIIAVGTIVSSLASERLTLRFGAGVVTAISVGMTAAALVGFSASDQFWMLCLWAIPYGLGAGAVDAALNNYVALHYAARHMNWLHSFWGVGASISPFVMGLAISTGSGWPSAYLVIGAVQAVLTLALLISIPLWGKVDRERTRARTAQTHELVEDAPAQKGSAPVPLKTALKVPGVVLILLAFFAYCSLESTALVWSASYMVSERGAPPAAAAVLGALFVLGLTAGRFLAGFFADRIGDRALIRGGFIAIGVGSVLLLLPLPTDVVGFVGLVIVGLGSAPVYPAIIHSTPGNFGRRNSQAIIGIQMAAAYVGSTLAPPLFGLLSTWTGMWIFPLYIGALVVLGLVMSERLNRVVPSPSGAAAA
ncbi:MAG: MFS transporter [Brachybacterium sp.]